MVVFYGSQTGTAEEFAARLGKTEIFRENDFYIFYYIWFHEISS